MRFVFYDETGEAIATVTPPAITWMPNVGDEVSFEWREGGAAWVVAGRRFIFAKGTSEPAAAFVIRPR